jgi:hypothetical protein
MGLPELVVGTDAYSAGEIDRSATAYQERLYIEVSVSIKNQENEVMVETDTPTKHRARFGVWTQ